MVDEKNVEMDLKNVHFYWEEKISDTAFVPHELREMPVKRGTATVNVKFESIKELEVRPGVAGGLPVMTITLQNGKRGEFPLALSGTLKGESDFGGRRFPSRPFAGSY